MIEEQTIYLLAGVVYAVTVAVLLGWRRRIPERHHSLCSIVTVIVGAAGVGSLLWGVGVGGLTVNGFEIIVPSLLEDLLTYSGLYAVAALLANVRGRLLHLAIVIPLIQRLAFTGASIAGGGLALLFVLVVVGGHFALIYLFVGPIWETAQDVSPERRLLHWKARNLLLFLIGMLIVYAVLALTGIFDAFVQSLLTMYIDVVIRVGFAGFLFANIGSLDETDGGSGLGFGDELLGGKTGGTDGAAGAD